MDRRTPVVAYPVQVGGGRSRKNVVILAAISMVVAVTIFFNAAKVDSVVTEGRHAMGRLGEKIPDVAKRPFSNLHNPFKPHAHPPVVQPNSTLGEASWFSDWTWLNPFSSTVTLDEDRALLPLVEPRSPVYTYYEPRDSKKQPELKKAEERLLDVWRRAWWAQGFRPVILGPADAVDHPLYQRVSALNTTAGVGLDFMRLLAWSHMGDGFLVNWLVVPMAEYYHPLLNYLRTGRYTRLHRYNDMDLGLLVGPKAELDKTIGELLLLKSVETDESLLNTISHKEAEALFFFEDTPKGVAFYGERVIKELYPDIARISDKDGSNAYRMLAELITAHLQTTFLNKYPGGFAIVNPRGFDASVVPHRALALANAINTCPSDPKISPEDTSKPISSCPPNNRKCTSCQSIPLHFPSAAPNVTTMFTIGTVPHTYTMTRLLANHDANFNFSLSYIRRQTSRDPFLEAVTADISPPKLSSLTWIVHFKEFVAQPKKGAMRSLWRTAEADWSWEALEWRLGFALPRPAMPDRSDVHGLPVPQTAIPPLALPPTTVPGGEEARYPELLEPLLNQLRTKPSASDVAAQLRIVEQTGGQLAEKKWPAGAGHDLRRICEAWNLADLEAWKFVRALTAREEVERRKWMEEEKRYRA